MKNRLPFYETKVPNRLAQVDKAVLEAYGWHDLAESAHCEFLLDCEEEGEELGTGGKSQSLTPKAQSRRRKPYRLRRPDDFRDEVLAPLLELNEQRHKEELLLAKQSAKAEKEDKKPKKTGNEKGLF